VHVEIERGDSVKYEFKEGVLHVDRILHTAYPFNYGYIPGTLAGDGDPLDVVVLTGTVLRSGCYVDCRVIGVLYTSDEMGVDNKIIAVPTTDAEQRHVLDLPDVPTATLDRMRQFFEVYKMLEPGKFVIVDKFGGAEEALRCVAQSEEEYQKQVQG
jgi:inorganic pyrophosphatase